MLISWKRIGRAALVGLGLVGVSAPRADAGLVLSYNNPGVQASTVAGVTTETFDSYSTGTYAVNGYSTAIGSFTSPGIAVVAANLYGGAGGTGNYFAIGAESGTTTATLALKGAEGYFGFWWSAADSGNSLAFYSGDQLLGTFSAASALSSLSSAYNGNPNSKFSGNTGEKYAYLNFTGTNGTTFDRIVFTNAGTGTGFEADNFSILAGSTAVSGNVVSNGITAASVPEPSSLAMVAVGGLIGGGTWLRRRRIA